VRIKQKTPAFIEGKRNNLAMLESKKPTIFGGLLVFSIIHFRVMILLTRVMILLKKLIKNLLVWTNFYLVTHRRFERRTP
jgi:hypothetical protein